MLFPLFYQGITTTIPILNKKALHALYNGAHTQSRTGDLSLTKGVLYHLSYASHMERVAGIEPAQPAWKAGVLPLNYTRLNLLRPSAPL